MAARQIVKVKICGLTRLADIDAVNAEMPDYIGFVFANSRRHVSPEQAMELRERLRAGIIPVGVFVDALPGFILALAQGGTIEAVQLHGAESEEYIRRIKALTGKPVIKAISVQNEGDVQAWSHSSSDYLLLDGKSGGSGEKFNWDLIGTGHGDPPGITPISLSGVAPVAKPFFLAGGLNPGNVAEAIAKTAPYAVDVSGGVETDGVKDVYKIKEFIRAARKCCN